MGVRRILGGHIFLSRLHSPWKQRKKKIEGGIWPSWPYLGPPLVTLCDRVLPFLWSIPTRMRISLNVVWLKGVFHECTNPLKTPHGLIKKNNKVDVLKEERRELQDNILEKALIDSMRSNQTIGT